MFLPDINFQKLFCIFLFLINNPISASNNKTAKEFIYFFLSELYEGKFLVNQKYYNNYHVYKTIGWDGYSTVIKSYKIISITQYEKKAIINVKFEIVGLITKFGFERSEWENDVSILIEKRKEGWKIKDGSFESYHSIEAASKNEYRIYSNLECSEYYDKKELNINSLESEQLSPTNTKNKCKITIRSIHYLNELLRD